MKAVLTPDLVKNRVIRVFISSTFHDMKEEREHLVKHVFPQLRSMCEKRGVTWGAIDLRWGITDEEQAEGKVLPICLREIGECKPFFIGMLGDRYGSVPDEIPEELVNREPWLDEHRDRSVCELEILHGALNDPGTADHAYFYLRDPVYVNTVTAEKRVELIESPTNDEIEQLGDAKAENRAQQRRKKLIDLKDRIRQSGLPVRESYENPKQLGERVLEDFRTVIDDLFPEDEEFDPLDQEAAEHDAFAQSRFRVYIRRDEYFDRLNGHVQSDGQPLVVLGESGSGKSALLANWIEKYREEHPEDHVITHFIGATPYSADWAAMLRRIMGEFKRRFDIQQDIPTEPDKLRPAFTNWLHMASAAAGQGDAKIVLILDALNQLEDRDQAPDLVWLPPSIPENIRLILSTLPGRPLDDLTKREWSTMDVMPLQDSECRQLIDDYLGFYGKNLNTVRIDKITSSEHTSNPLYLRALLDELRQFGVHPNLNRAIKYFLDADTIPALYEKILRRLEQDYDREWPGLVQDAMTCIWASRRGLSEEELLDLLGTDGEPLPRGQWIRFHDAVERMWVNRGGLLGFAHDYIREAIHERYLHDEKKQKAARLLLADYFTGKDINPRKVDELPWQLSEAEDWQRLNDLLGDLEFFHEAWEKDQFEVKTCWAKVENSSDLSLVDAYQRVLVAPDKVTNDETVMHISNLLADTGHLSESLILHKFLTDIYRKSGENKKLSVSLRVQGVILWHQADCDGAMELFKEDERICRELGDKQELSSSQCNQGNILWQRGDYDGAMALFKEHERISRELGDKSGLSKSFSNQGGILWQRGDLEGAMELFKEDERICRELGNKSGLSKSLGYQGIILYLRGDLDGAMKLYKEQERICREFGDKFGLSSSLGNQGLLLKDRGDYDGAMVLYKKQERICREFNDKRGLSASLSNQGNILKDRGDYDGALKFYKEKEYICRELSDKHELSISLVGQGDAYKELGEYDKAMNLLREAESIAREIGIPDQEAQSLSQQADVLFRQGEPEKALPLAEEAYEIATRHEFADQIETSKAILDKIRAELEK